MPEFKGFDCDLCGNKFMADIEQYCPVKMSVKVTFETPPPFKNPPPFSGEAVWCPGCVSGLSKKPSEAIEEIVTNVMGDGIN